VVGNSAHSDRSRPSSRAASSSEAPPSASLWHTARPMPPVAPVTRIVPEGECTWAPVALCLEQDLGPSVSGKPFEGSWSMRHRSAKGNATEPCCARSLAGDVHERPRLDNEVHRRTELSPHVGARTACARCASTAKQLGDERARHHVLTVTRSRETNWTCACSTSAISRSMANMNSSRFR